MTPILIEFYKTDSISADGIWLRFFGAGGTPGIRNLTGVPWAGIEFRTAWSVLAQDPLFRDEYFYFEPNTGSTDNIFFARTAPNEGFSWANRYGAPYSADLTFGLHYDILSEYPLYQKDNENVKRLQPPISDIAQINFAPGMPETSGLSGEMHLAWHGLSGDSWVNGYYYVLITPIAASAPVEHFAITNFTRSGNTAELRWPALPTNTPVRVERTTDLSGPWTAIATNLISGSFTDTNAPTRSAFYRLVTEP